MYVKVGGYNLSKPLNLTWNIPSTGSHPFTNLKKLSKVYVCKGMSLNLSKLIKLIIQHSQVNEIANIEKNGIKRI